MSPVATRRLSWISTPTKLRVIFIALCAVGAFLQMRRSRIGRQFQKVEFASKDAARRACAERVTQLDHDLRTPIGTIAAALELLDTGSDAERAETREVLARQVVRLTIHAQRLRELAGDLDGSAQQPATSSRA